MEIIKGAAHLATTKHLRHCMRLHGCAERDRQRPERHPKHKTPWKGGAKWEPKDLLVARGGANVWRSVNRKKLEEAILCGNFDPPHPIAGRTLTFGQFSDSFNKMIGFSDKTEIDAVAW